MWSISMINFLSIFRIFCIISLSFMIPPKTKQHELSPARKNKFIGAVIAGKRIAKAACFFDIKDPTAQSIWKKYKKMGSAKNLTCSGCPEKLSGRDKRLLIRTARKERWTPFGELRNKLGLQVGDTTVRTILAQAGYHRRVACKKPFLSQRHCSLHIAWACLYQQFLWRKVMWSDEAYIYVGDKHGHIFITRRANEEFMESCLVLTFKQSSIQVMVNSEHFPWIRVYDSRNTKEVRTTDRVQKEPQKPPWLPS